MKDIELHQLLSNSTSPPDCPTDKFVAGFMAQMDKDLAPTAEARKDSKFLMYGSIAAALLVAVGGITMFQVGNNFSRPKLETAQMQTAQITPANDAEIIDVIDNEIAEDDFAAQLIGEEDISTIVPIGTNNSNP